MPKPILNLEEYEKQHRELDHKLKTHMISGRGRHLFDDPLVERLLDRSASRMYAVNARARIGFVAAVRTAFLNSRQGGDRPYAVVTFAPRQFACTLSEASEFDHRGLQDWSRKWLKQFHFIGMVEAALYTNANALPGTAGPMVSWHVHAVVWGKDLHKLDALRDRMNLMLDPLLPGATVAHVRHLKGRGAAKRVIYMSKGPLHEYRVFPKKEEIADPETGELRTVSLKEFRQRKRPLRPGDAVRLVKVIGTRTVRDLAFSSGDGDRILSGAFRLAKRRIQGQDARHRRKLRRLLGRPNRKVARRTIGKRPVRSRGSAKSA